MTGRRATVARAAGGGWDGGWRGVGCGWQAVVGETGRGGRKGVAFFGAERGRMGDMKTTLGARGLERARGGRERGWRTSGLGWETRRRKGRGDARDGSRWEAVPSVRSDVRVLMRVIRSWRSLMEA